MGKKKAPTFDANRAVDAQTSANRTAQQANARAAQQYGPFGSVTARTDDAGNIVGQSRELDPLLGGAADDILETTAGYTGFLPQQQFTTAGAIQNQGGGVPVGQALFDGGMTYLRPQFEQQSRDLQTTLLNRGLPIGSEAWSDATGNLADSQNRALVDLSSRATLATPAEEQRLIGNEILQRNQGAADISTNLGLLGGIQGLAPQFGGAATQANVDAMGAYRQQYQSQLAAHQAKQAAIGDLVKTGIGVAAAIPTGGASLGLMRGMGGGGGGMGSNIFNSPRGYSIAPNAYSDMPYAAGLPWAPA